MVVTYTSENVYATTQALASVKAARNVRTYGSALSDWHHHHGGYAEVLVAVWRRKLRPQILELMPMAYKPAPRTGIVGIGNRAVLQHFQSEFDPNPEDWMEPEVPAEAWKRLEAQLGHPIIPPPRTFPIERAALTMAAVFSTAIEQVGGGSVGLPVQVMVISHGEARAQQIDSTGDLSEWESITPGNRPLRSVLTQRGRAPQCRHALSALQLFD
jgi:hypothetical protein